MGSIAVPLHFTTSFLVTVAAAGGVWVALRRPAFAPPGKWARRAFGAGWALLGLGELMHGSLIAPTELDYSMVALKTSGYALIVLSLLPPDRRAGKAAKTPTAGAVAASGSSFMTTFLSISAAVFAFRYPLASIKRLAAAFAAFAASEVMFGLIGDLSASRPSLLWMVAHALRLVGGIGVGFWLWAVVRNSIQVRFIAVFLGLLMIVVVVLAGSMTAVFSANVTQQSLQRAEREGEAQKRVLFAEESDAVSSAGQVAQLDSIRRAVATRDPILDPTLKRLQSPGGAFDKYDFIAFMDPSGGILALSATGRNGAITLNETDAVSLAGTSVVQTAIRQQQSASLEAIGPAKIAVVAAYPVFNPPGFDPPGVPQGLAGVVTFGRIIDEEYLHTIQIQDQQEAFLLTRKIILGRTNPDPTGVIPQNSDDYSRLFEEGKSFSGQTVIGNRDFFTSYIPLERSDNSVVGALAIAQYSEVLDLTQRNVGRTLFLAALIAAGIATITSWFSGRRITSPIVELTRAAEMVRAGDLDVKIGSATNDEVGVLGRAFDEMTDSISRLTTDLRSSAEQLDTIIQSMAEGVVAVDAEGVIVAYNVEAERILGVSAADAKGSNVSEVLRIFTTDGKVSRPPIYELGSGSINGVVGSGNEAKPVAVTSAPIADDQGVAVGGVAVIRDLTSELQVEKMKTEFLSNISHELRTPLTPIQGYADLMRRKSLPRDKQVVMLDTILSSTRRLHRIVEMLVDFSAMEAGRLMPRKVSLDLDGATAKLIHRWQEDASKHRFERKGFSKLPQLTMDERLIPLAINELIDNAVKFSPKGGRIVVSAEVDKGEMLRLAVADQGIGIAKEDLLRIGEEFIQIDPSETRAYGGLGLGLAYVRRIVESHGGHLEAESAVGRGSKFSLVLPIGSVPGDRVTKASARVVAKPAPASSSKSSSKAGTDGAKRTKRTSSARTKKPIRSKKSR
ncbi:MAG: ATP-binding protein [Actinomycetota bacterium]|nr:HAMP domain-containing protein [Actinomycetota bacterium]